MESPTHGYVLRRLEGDADAISEHGRILGELASTMESTAARLVELGDSSIYRSQATDKLSTTAAEVEADLRAASTRYAMTGTVVSRYGEALSEAQGWINPNVERIRDAEDAYQEALTDLDDARSHRDGLDSVMPWESEPTAEQSASAQSAVTTAVSALSDAKETRDAYWSQFETHLGAWSTEYDAAVGGIENAMETANNNDGFWEGLDNFLTVLGWVVLGLSIIALVIGAPLFGALGLIVLGLSALIVVGRLVQFAFGQATLSDVAWSLVGLLPFGLGKVLSRGAPVLSTVVRGAQGTAAASIRAGLPSLRLLTPFRNVSTVWQWMRAPAVARGALPSPGMLVNPLSSIRLGSAQTAQVDTFITTMSNSPYAAALAGNIANAAGAMPGAGAQAINVVLWAAGVTNDTASNLDVQPEIPGLSDITIDDGPIR